MKRLRGDVASLAAAVGMAAVLSGGIAQAYRAMAGNTGSGPAESPSAATTTPKTNAPVGDAKTDQKSDKLDPGPARPARNNP